ncbi:cytochrome P450 [Symbioplanes lichenis]|uniref:cytochrome P450 n=1 Tax=Symbioplanes lichenis TaxID=1629072 RepID=UPI002739939B|nr:cytochrome P450 [Actinoplanes lichenis]
MALEFDRFSPAHVADPYPLYERARHEAPVTYADAFGVWVVTRYDDVRTVLGDTDRFSNDFLIRTPLVAADGVREILAGGHPELKVLLNEDPPAHGRSRALVAAAFSPRRTRQLAPRIQVIADELIDGFAADSSTDLMAAYALPLPLRVICEMLGIPPADAGQVRAWTEELKVLTSFDVTPERQREAAHGSVAFERYLAALVEERRAAPGDDLLSDLLTYDTPELVSLLLTLIFGGHETTANLIGSALLRSLRDDTGVDEIIEETLRLDPPVQGSFRKVVRDTELSGVRVPAGAQVFAVIGSANHDAPAEPSLSFGRGIHYCVGAQLAKLEAHTALTTLARRLPGLRLAEDFEAPYVPNLMHRGLVRLDVVRTP